MRKVLNGAIAQLPFPHQADLSELGVNADRVYRLLSLLRCAEEVSPLFVAPSLLLATRRPQQLGGPLSHVHSSQFHWPTEVTVETRDPSLSTRFIEIYQSASLLSATLRELAKTALNRKATVEQEIATIEDAIDERVYELIGLSLTVVRSQARRGKRPGRHRPDQASRPETWAGPTCEGPTFGLVRSRDG